jgi:hypothetical protein
MDPKISTYLWVDQDGPHMPLVLPPVPVVYNETRRTQQEVIERVFLGMHLFYNFY